MGFPLYVCASSGFRPTILPITAIVKAEAQGL